MKKIKFDKYLFIVIAIVAIVGLSLGYALASPTFQNSNTNEELTTDKTDDLGYGGGFGKNNNEGKGMGMGGGSGQGQGIHKGNCLGDDCLYVDELEYPAGDLTDEAIEALSKAIDDEYKAYSTYEAVINSIGPNRPFTMIIRAEDNHISALKAVYEKYGLEIPANPYAGQITAPETYQEACQTGVEAEIANAALYNEELLPAVEEYEDITAVFTNLMNASQEKHLPAFERCN